MEENFGEETWKEEPTWKTRLRLRRKNNIKMYLTSAGRGGVYWSGSG